MGFVCVSRWKLFSPARRFTPAGFLVGLVKLQVLLAIALSCEAVGTLNHLNCGTVGTLMRGGAIGATLEALPTPLGSVNICCVLI